MYVYNAPAYSFITSVAGLVFLLYPTFFVAS
ncbi:hypothetical protein VIBNIMADA3020_370012 [Vibrio nigripulchritudo MADA3020]|nr:hypothetical protein VIBNIMADA3020_370012 [Vibrio nigripulchritudo MADA3020]CCN53618.1 hypothetical protein VIBNIMADA3021_340030 [Vibrio nigripulchritudo MADA3021]